MLCATHWAGLLFVSNCLFICQVLCATLWEGLLVCFCLFVCVFSKFLHMHTLPHPWRMFVFLKYMPGALPPIGKVYLFVCLFVCLFVFSQNTHVYLYPTHGGFVVYFVPFFEKRYLFKVVCGLSSALLPAHSCKQHLFPTHSH